MSIKLKGSSDGSVSFDAPADTSPSGSDITLVLPTTVGSAEQFLKNSGTAGTLEFSSMVETSTGVGIGTTSPGLKLHIQDGALASAPTPNSNCDVVIEGSTDTGIQFLSATQTQLRFGDAASTGAGSLIYNHSSDYLSVSTSASERMRIDSSGVSVNSGNLSMHSGGRIFVGNGGNAVNPMFANVSDTNTGIAFPSADTMLLSTGGSERLRITSSGTVGIGESNPAYELDVASSDTTTVNITAGGTTNISRLFFSDTTVARGYLNYDHSSDSLQIATASSERMRIDSSGNVGIGTTSPGQGQAQINITAAGSDNYSAIALNLTNNSTDSGTGVSLRFSPGNVQTALRGSYINSTISGANGSDLQLWYCPSGFAPREGMRITSSGYLRASADISDSEYYSSASGFHGITSSNSNAAVLIVEHSSDTDPYGILIDFTDDNPDNNSNYFIRCGDSSVDQRMVVWSDGDLDNHDNSYGGTSDQKLKQDIVDAGSQWDDLKDLRVRKFKFKSDVAAYGDEAKTLIGLVAQEAEAVCPGLVKDNPDLDGEGNDLGTVTKSVRYSVLYMKAIKALQEAMDRIETLEAKVAALEAQ